MVTGLIDTAIVVDLLRNYPPASAWLKTQPQLGISSIVAFEVLEGAQNKTDQQRATALLTQFEMLRIIPSDQDWALQQLLAYKLSHNIGMMDCLIASINHRLQLPLFTHNLKHFNPLLGALAQKPY